MTPEDGPRSGADGRWPAPPVTWPATDRVAAAAAGVPERTALVDAATGRSWSYRELSTGPVATMAAALRDCGLEPGDHLGVVVEPGARLAALVHAAARAGVVFVPLSPDAPADVLAERCTAADIDRLVADGSTAPVARRAFDGPVDALDGLQAAGNGSVDGGSADPYRWAADDVQWLVFTSGTTGEPTAVRLTAGNLVASATASARRLGVEPDDRWLACLPTHHVGGLAPLTRSAQYGTAAIVQDGFDVDATAAAAREHDVTGVSLVPTMLVRLLDAGWTPPDSLRFVLLGGAPASPALVDRCEAAGVPVHPTYGATETASQVATARPEEAFAHRGTVGRPLDGTEVRVLDEAGEPQPPDEPGAIVVSGPTVSPGYCRADEATARRLEGGRFHTRDRGYLDDDGRLWVLGRVDDAIQTGGETVHPREVEAVIRAHPAVADAAVVGVADPEWGDVVAALVVADAGVQPDGATLREYCREGLEPAAVPKQVVVADALPRTASGTIDRGAVARRLAGSRDREVG